MESPFLLGCYTLINIKILKSSRGNKTKHSYYKKREMMTFPLNNHIYLWFKECSGQEILATVLEFNQN